VYNSLLLTWRGVWSAVLLRSRARGASSTGAKSVYPDPKARASPRRKSLRGTFARLSVRKHKRRQVLANLRLRSWTNLWLVPVCYLFFFFLRTRRGPWWTETSTWLVQRCWHLVVWIQSSDLSTARVDFRCYRKYPNLACDWLNGGCVYLFDSSLWPAPGLPKLHSYQPAESSFWLVQWRMRPRCKCTWMGQVGLTFYDTLFNVTQCRKIFNVVKCWRNYSLTVCLLQWHQIIF